MKRTNFICERGFSLIEAMVTTLIVALSLLGHMTLQQRTMANQQAAIAQSLATSLAVDLAERILANPTALANYDTPDGDFINAVDVAATDCAEPGAVCSSEQLASFDLNRWFERANQLLPNAMFRIADPLALATRSNHFEITLGWNDQRDAEAPLDCDSDNAKCITIIRAL